LEGQNSTESPNIFMDGLARHNSNGSTVEEELG